MNKQEKLQRVQDFLQLLDKEHLSRDEFLQAIQTLTKQIKDLEGQLIKNVSDQTKTEKQELQKLKVDFNKLIQKSKKESDSTLAGFKRRTYETIDKLFAKNQVNKKLKQTLNEYYSKLKQADEKIKEVDTKLANISNGRDGIDGRDGKDADPAEAAQITYEIVREKQTKTINKLQKQIDKLEKKIKKLRKRKPEVVYGGSSHSGGRVVMYHDLSSSLDGGVTRTFQLPAFYRIISVHLSSFPNILREGIDFTVNGSNWQITFTAEIPDNSLASGQTCIITYSEI